MSFIDKHWRGELPLWLSFWVIGFLPLVLIRVIEPHWLKSLPLDNSWAAPMVWAYVAVVLLLIFPWQAVGVLRCAFHHFEQYGRSHILYTVQALVIGAGIAAASHSLYTLQRFTALADQHAFDTRKAEERAVLEISADNPGQLNLSGPLTFGVTNEMRALLKTHADIDTVVLESPGGQIYEGRGLALLFIEYALSTHVLTYCYSSCTTAFIGGEQRSMAAQAKFGFHQYGLDVDRPRQSSSAYNPLAEQVKDAALFVQQGVSESFTESMFRADASDMWYPDVSELLGAKVIHRLQAEAE